MFVIVYLRNRYDLCTVDMIWLVRKHIIIQTFVTYHLTVATKVPYFKDLIFIQRRVSRFKKNGIKAKIGGTLEL